MEQNDLQAQLAWNSTICLTNTSFIKERSRQWKGFYVALTSSLCTLLLYKFAYTHPQDVIKVSWGKSNTHSNACGVSPNPTRVRVGYSSYQSWGAAKWLVWAVPYSHMNWVLWYSTSIWVSIWFTPWLQILKIMHFLL